MVRFCLACLLGVIFCSAPVWAKEIKLAVVTTPGSAQYICAQKFKELVEQHSEGHLTVKLYHSGSLGNETEILQQIQLNAVQMGIITLGPFDVFVPEVKVVAFPFIFRDYEHVDQALDGPAGRRVLDSLEAAGFKGLAFSENGFRHVTNSERPIKSVEDVAGLKIRVMESELHKELWRTLGANPTPMGWPIYTELQQGTIDGQENPLSVVVVYKLHEVQPYLSLSGHVYSAHINVANLAWFESLDEQSQHLLQQAALEAAAYQRQWNRENEAAFLKQLREKGMQVVVDPDRASFRKKAATLRSHAMFASPEIKSLLQAIEQSTP